MGKKEIIEQLNVLSQCRKYGLALWQCPQVLFLVMGGFIIITISVAYLVGARYVEDPEIIALLVLFLAAILFVVASIVVQSFERLAEANRLKSEFIAIVSHQLRSPLTSLRWALDFVLSGSLGKIEERPLEYLKILKENSDRMEELVKDLLIVSRLEQKSLTFLRREVFLENLIKELLAEYAPFAAASNIEIKLDFQNNLPKVFIDPFQIKITIEALLDNAIRYTKGKGKIEIKLASDNKNLYFEIKDQGIGIPAGERKYIFQKFFRSANALRHQTQGSGLGLFIAKTIIERSGGKIGFKSEEGKGTTFWFTLPLK